MDVIITYLISNILYWGVYYFCIGVLHMEPELKAALIGAGTTVVVAIVAGVIALFQENSKLKKIIRHLGFGEDEASMKNQLDSRFRQIDERFEQVDERFGKNNTTVPKSVLDQTGVGTDEKSLTKQHNELKEVILARIDTQVENINTISQKIHDEEVRRSSLAVEQQSLLHTVNALIYDWEMTHQKLSEMECRCSELEAENEQLKQELSEFHDSEDDEWEQ